MLTSVASLVRCGEISGHDADLQATRRIDVGGLKVTPEERERMTELCKQIQTERKPEIFDQLVRELNDLLEIKHERIHPEHNITSR